MDGYGHTVPSAVCVQDPLLQGEGSEFTDLARQRPFPRALSISTRTKICLKASTIIFLWDALDSSARSCRERAAALLLREAGLTDTGERKYASVTGAKDYRWLESEAVYQLQMQEDIDKRYFNREVDEAVEEISKYGDFNWFVGDDGVAPWTAPDLPWSDAQEEAARNFDVR